ncbi:MAG: undecaprenyl-diphosphate phosphatase [Rickettsiales bacterium]|nr:undecaprenyl-diphosphate phosphatase [Rickettsiales bacterium]
MLHLADLFKAIFLGIVEGLTEFIPVSSTAHLLISSYLIDFQTIQNNLFEIVIQFGAILAICVIYRQKIFTVIFNLKQKREQQFALNLALAFLPAAILGALLHGFIKQFLFSNFVIALTLIIGGVFMILIERKPRKSKVETVEDIKPLTAFKVGLCQSLAMIPGVSRSGATIIGGLLLGLNRKSATEFSFFLAIPTIAAASLYDLLKNSAELNATNTELILVGLLAAFFSAILVIKWFINFVSKHNFIPFGIYRIAVGILILLFIS